MQRQRGRTRPAWPAAVAAAVAFASLPGCSDSQQTGSVVEQSQEQKDAQQKSQEGMMKAMEAMKKGQPKSK